MIRPDPYDLVVQSAVEELARLSFAEHSLESLLQKVTDLTARVLPGWSAASVTVIRQGRPGTVATSDPLAAELDEVQYRQGGPCVEAASTGRPIGDSPPVRNASRSPSGAIDR